VNGVRAEGEKEGLTPEEERQGRLKAGTELSAPPGHADSPDAATVDEFRRVLELISPTGLPATAPLASGAGAMHG